jgi:hypothetical protein
VIFPNSSRSNAMVVAGFNWLGQPFSEEPSSGDRLGWAQLREGELPSHSKRPAAIAALHRFQGVLFVTQTGEDHRLFERICAATESAATGKYKVGFWGVY